MRLKLRFARIKDLGISSKISLTSIKRLLEETTVYFSYIEKTTGQLREAIGTRHPNLIPAFGRVKSHNRIWPTGLLCYWDFTCNEWRSFYTKNLVHIHRWKDKKK